MGLLVVLACLLGTGHVTWAQVEDDSGIQDRIQEELEDSGAEETDAVADPLVLPLEAKPTALPGSTIADTVRTNIWLTEALMGEIATRTARVMPLGASAVRLMPGGTSDSDEMLTEAMVRVLGGLGHTLYLPDADEARQAAVDHIVTYHVVGVELSYPDVGRTLGIWRQWIARELSVTAQVEVSDADSGRLLLSDRITRTYNDRVGDGDFDDVNSNLYDFSNADTQESGWQRRMEEIVVLGTLAGLVAVYFANTTD